jgi:eRF1 domain 3
MELVESQPLLEWLANNYKSFGATLEIITDKSQEGSQFVRGFGGIGGKFSALKSSNILHINKQMSSKQSFLDEKDTIIKIWQKFVWLVF